MDTFKKKKNDVYQDREMKERFKKIVKVCESSDNKINTENILIY